MNKKILSLAMAIMICIATSIPAFAAITDSVSGSTGGCRFTGTINGARNRLTGATEGNGLYNGTAVDITFTYVKSGVVKYLSGSDAQDNRTAVVEVNQSNLDQPLTGEGYHYGATNNGTWSDSTYLDYTINSRARIDSTYLYYTA